MKLNLPSNKKLKKKIGKGKKKRFKNSQTIAIGSWRGRG
jgi:hypothetical protein